MADYVLTSLKSVETAIGVLSKAQGAYTAVDILKGVLSDVDEPQQFEAELRKSELQQFNSFEGPADADREILKAMKTAANAESEKQNPLLELVSLVLVRLGFVKGSKVLSLLLVACGFDPTLSLVVFKLCLVLARTKEGKKIVRAALPKFKDAIAASADRTQLDELLTQLVERLGEKGAELVAIIQTSVDMGERTAQAGAGAADDLLDKHDVKSSDEGR
nr:hypothetical protein [uncultured bacterium]